MDPSTFIEIMFPMNHERCFDYYSNPIIVSELEYIFQDPLVLGYFEEKIILEYSEESFCSLFRCHNSAEEREKEIDGLKSNKVFTTCNYYDEREEGYVSKTYGPGAYYLVGISDYVYDRKPYCLRVLFDLNVFHTTVIMPECLYNRYVFSMLYYEMEKKLCSATIQMLFSYWLKHIKGVIVLKICETQYNYPIVIFL